MKDFGMSSKTTTKQGGASRSGERYDATSKLGGGRLRQQTVRLLAQVARGLGVTKVSLSAWEVRYGTELDPLERHFGKGYGHHGPGPKAHFEMITAIQHDYHIGELREAFGVSRSGYYNHLRKAACQRLREDEALRQKIEAAFHESPQTYGTPRLRIALRKKNGTCISRERIAGLIRELGPQPLRKRRFIPCTTQSDPAANASPNLLPDRPAPTAPGHAWVSNISCIATGKGWLAAWTSMRAAIWAGPGPVTRARIGQPKRSRVPDSPATAPFSPKLSPKAAAVASTVPAAYRTDLALLGMIEKLGPHGQPLRQRHHGMPPRSADPPLGLTSAGQPVGLLPRSARLWASLKTDALCSVPATHAEARLLIHDYIDAFYNTRRHHSSIDFKSPIDFERSFSGSIN